MYATRPGYRIIHEFALPQHGARIDIAVVADRLVGFEMKTASDSLVRLPQQQRAYGMVFDRMFIAVEPKHMSTVMEVVPTWWGVLELTAPTGRRKWTQRRRARLNPDGSVHALVQLLWREEVLAELEELGLAGGKRSATRAELWARLAEAAPVRLPRRELQARVRTRLMNRADWRAA